MTGKPRILPDPNQIAAADLQPQLPELQVELVVDDDHPRRRDLVEPRQLADCLPGLVHEGARLGDDQLVPGRRPQTRRRDDRFGDASTHAARSRKARPGAPGELIGCHEPDIVAGSFVLWAGVTQPDQ